MMQKITEQLRCFTAGERILWASSAALIILSFAIFDGESMLTLLASLIGVTSLIFSAKGNPIGQLLMVIFSLLYGVISYETAYYGEMITYLGMTMPMAAAALVSWLKNPYEGRRAQVRVGGVTGADFAQMCVLTAVVTAVFYVILAHFHTAHLALSTLSVTTSFAAVYLTCRRSPLFALAYAANDVVLIALWSLASAEQRAYVSVVVCFFAFLVNDLYGYISWRRMKRRQACGL